MTADERAALVKRLRADALPDGLRVADLIEADGKRLALADAAPHTEDCNTETWTLYSQNGRGRHDCTCWKADYDAAKEAL